MTGWVVIFDWSLTTPIYHGFDNDRLNEKRQGFRADYTRCGRAAVEYNVETKRSRSFGDWIPARHVKKFARPCGRCWPNSEAPS